MPIDNRSYLGTGIDEAVHLQKSPLAEGFISGLKAALLGAPIGAAANALRGKDAVTGALVGALLPALVAGLSTAAKRKVENLDTEAQIRYHAANIRSREPFFFMPPKQEMGRYFSKRYD